MQFFTHGRDEFAAAALTAATRSLKMCQHLIAFDRNEHEVASVRVRCLAMRSQQPHSLTLALSLSLSLGQ